MTGFLTIVVVILGIILLGKVLKIFELSGELRGADANAVTTKDNRTQSLLVLVFGIGFLVFVVLQYLKFKDIMLPSPASEHGVLTDGLLTTTWWIIGPMFFITHILLIYFVYKYYHRPERKATFFAHSTKLELIWTVIPTIVLTTLIVYGISIWNSIMAPAAEDAMVVELYAKQFDWTGRYAGEDNKLGRSGYRLIEGANVLGVDMTDEFASDDKVARGELHLPKGKSVSFKFHSRDVIHSAYMPHFRAQMNCVPGMTTQFHFVPTKTTEEMRKETGNPEFDYVLLCNKICGSAHYNMQMTIVVEEEEEFNKWLHDKKTLAEELGGVEVVVEEEEHAEVVLPVDSAEQAPAIH